MQGCALLVSLMWVCVAVLYCVSVECEVPECWIVEETRRKFALMMQEFSTQGTEDTAYITYYHLYNSNSITKLSSGRKIPHHILLSTR